jgi:hypothetical protein
MASTCPCRGPTTRRAGRTRASPRPSGFAKGRIALAQVRTILQAGFTITGVVVDADFGTNAAFRAGLERLGLSYGVAIRGEATCAVVGVPGLQSAAAVALSAPEDAWESVAWGTGTAGPLTARFCALRVRPRRDAATGGCSVNALLARSLSKKSRSRIGSVTCYLLVQRLTGVQVTAFDARLSADLAAPVRNSIAIHIHPTTAIAMIRTSPYRLM